MTRHNASIEMGKSEIGALLASLVCTIPSKRSALATLKLSGTAEPRHVETMERSLEQDVSIYDTLSFIHTTMEGADDTDFDELQEEAAAQWPDEGDSAVKS